MIQFQNQTRSLLVSSVVAFATLGLSSGVSANASYNGYADFEITLDSVTNTGQGGQPPAPADWSVSSTGSIVDSDTSQNGGGSADIYVGVDDPNPSWSVGDSLVQYSESDGSLAGAGQAISFADTVFSIDIENLSDRSLTFEFSYIAFVEADVTADAGEDTVAYAQIALADAFIDPILISADVVAGSDNEYEYEEIMRTLSFSLGSDGRISNTIIGTVYSDGSAVSQVAVPTPATVSLLALGLLALVRLRRA